MKVKSILCFEMCLAAVTALVFSKDNNNLVSGAYDGTMKVWDLNEKKCIFNFKPPHFSQVTSLQISEDGSEIFSASFDKSVKFWRLSDGKCMNVIKDAHDEGV